MTAIIKNTFTRIFIPALAIILFFSCQKSLDGDLVPVNTNQNPDLTTKVNSSVSGFVTDENDAAVMGASVKVGIITTTTDKYGFFEVKNVDVVKTAAVVTVSMNGYFKGIKTYLGESNKSAFFRIKLIPKTNMGTISAGTGGNVTLSNGLIVALPANAVVNATTNAAYTGTVNVAVQWINPTAADLNQTMPGDLRGIATDGSLKTLTTYGMAAVELTGSAGELLQIATGKKATLTFPIPSAIIASAPYSIPLWSFDEAKGLWKEEGQATKTGSNYVGEVSHFSFWNCDVPANYVQFNCTIKDAAGNPISQAAVRLTEISNPYNSRFGFTDSSGYVGGLVPSNAQLKLEVYSNFNCGTVVHTQTFTTGNVSLSLGTITIPPASLAIAVVSGTVTNCSSSPVTNGYIIMLKDNQYFRQPISNTGSFSFTTIMCTSSAAVTFIAEDNNSMQQSSVLNYTLISGSNAVGNLQACGVSTQEFITYSIDGGTTSTTFTAPADSISHTGQGSLSVTYIFGFNNSNSEVNFGFTSNAIAAGSIQNLTGFSSTQINAQLSVLTPVNVNITEYGTVGQFIAGNFTGVVTNTVAPVTNYNVICSFRVRRSF